MQRRPKVPPSHVAGPHMRRRPKAPPGLGTCFLVPNNKEREGGTKQICLAPRVFYSLPPVP